MVGVAVRVHRRLTEASPSVQVARHTLRPPRPARCQGGAGGRMTILPGRHSRQNEHTPPVDRRLRTHSCCRMRHEARARQSYPPSQSCAKANRIAKKSEPGPTATRGLRRQATKDKPPGTALGVCGGLPDDVLLSRARCSLSSALKRFTVLFGMGRSGSTSLWSSGMTCRPQACLQGQSWKRRSIRLNQTHPKMRGCDHNATCSSADH